MTPARDRDRVSGNNAVTAFSSSSPSNWIFHGRNTRYGRTSGGSSVSNSHPKIEIYFFTLLRALAVPKNSIVRNMVGGDRSSVITLPVYTRYDGGGCEEGHTGTAFLFVQNFSGAYVTVVFNISTSRARACGLSDKFK